MNQHIGYHRGYRPVGEAFLALLERDQARHLWLCTMLERIADGLPNSGHLRRTANILAFLEKAYARHVFLHEKCLFPVIRRLEEKNEGVELILRQLEFEHAADQGLIVEILAAFMARDSHDRGLEALGYLLRSFFENFRRHSAWERGTLFPIARRHLADGARKSPHDALLRASMGHELPPAILSATPLC